MIVICEECGKNYRVDPEKIQGNKARFKCTDCGHLITALKSSLLEKKKRDGLSLFRPSNVRFGLTAKLFTMMIIISLVPLIMFWGINLKRTKDRIHYEAKKKTNQQFIRIARNIDAWFYENARVLKLLAKMSDIISMTPQKQEPLLNAVQQLHSAMGLTFIINKEGKFVSGAKGVPINKYTDEKYFKDIVNGRAFTWQTWIDKKSKKTGLLLAVPIMNTGTVAGVLANLITTENISRQIFTFETAKAGFALLLRDKGRVIAHPVKNDLHQKKKYLWQPLIAGFRKGKSGLISFNDPTGIAMLGFVGKTVFGWGIALQTEEEEVLDMGAQVLSFAYLLLSITVVFILFIAWFSGRALSSPIIKLTDAAERISVGELDMEIRTRRKDEIGDLSEAIARMQESIRLSIERLRRRR
jgi:predicted Zn finger-like uncharacterized protein